MTIVQKSALVKYSAAAMYDIVSDIKAYPEFLPWCGGSRIISQEGNIIEAELQIAKAGFRHAFATRNVNEEGGKITVSLLEGPFSSLEGVWDFKFLREDASKISLDLEFEMNGLLANLAFGAVFNQICNTMVSSFTERARKIHGT